MSIEEAEMGEKPEKGNFSKPIARRLLWGVAWFTANRAFDFKAGTFSVVNTKDNLQADLAAGIGTTVADSPKPHIVTETDYTLTDASFDHTSLTQDIIIPDDQGTEVLRVVNLANAVLGTANSGNHMFRETNIYSAFTWDVTFKLSFSQT